MPIRGFDEWASSRSQVYPLSGLKGAMIGIHASHYLDLHLNQNSTKEPLLIALGGFPFALQSHIEKELRALKNAGISCLFIFDGLEIGKPEPDIVAQNQSTRALEQAWGYYEQHQAEQVVDAFSNAGSANPESLYRFLQKILIAEDIEFMVAPYSAAPQLAYLENGPKPFIDAIYGPSELFLFGVDKIITKIDIDLSNFSSITKQTCSHELGNLSNDHFVDLCLLFGSPYLQTFPPFENTAFPGNIREALNMFNGAERNALALCAQFEEDPRVQELQYPELFKRAFMIVKHHIITEMDGKTGPMDSENAPGDMHELIGQRLPEELYFYLSKGIIGPTIPNWLTSGEIAVTLPLGTEDFESYRQIVSDTLTPIQTRSLCLLSDSLHRFYRTKAIEINLWYDDRSDRSINLKPLPSVKETITSWRLSKSNLPEQLQSLQGSSPLLTSSLAIAKDSAFTSKSFSAKDAPPLTTKDEILANVMWRFLQLRGYIDEKHNLTSWGKALETALSSLDPAEHLEEPVFLGVEMIRLGVLHEKELFESDSSSDEDKAREILISRVASLGKIRHKPIGYSGPLSRQLLAFHSLHSAVRVALRDLLEVVLASLFLNGEADRDLKDLSGLSLSLPFIDDNDCGLGIAVRTYLDDLPQVDEPDMDSLRGGINEKGKDWFQHTLDFPANLDRAFQLWDAVYKASQDGDFKNAPLWAESHSWLLKRR